MIGRTLWWSKYLYKRGFSASFHEYGVGPRIIKWRNPFESQPTQHLPLHVVCGHDYGIMALWMLASWFLATEKNWQVWIHDDGTLTDEDKVMFRRVFSDVLHLVDRKEADKRMQSVLVSAPRCADYRSRMPHGLKVFDVGTLTDAPRFLLFDPDVLFFYKPVDILEWVQQDEDPKDTVWFNADAQEPAPFVRERAPETLGFELWPYVNSGLCMLNKKQIDLSFFEHCLNLDFMKHCKDWRAEQTLLALAASRWGRGGLLSDAYEVSLDGPVRTDSIARHYIGAVRDRFWSEGVRRLKSKI